MIIFEKLSILRLEMCTEWGIVYLYFLILFEYWQFCGNIMETLADHINCKLIFSCLAI